MKHTTDKSSTEINETNQDDFAWVDRLIAWADKHKIQKPQFAFEEFGYEVKGFWVGFPRNKLKLLNLTELNLGWHDLTELPEELGNLKNLTSLSVAKTSEGAKPDWEPKTDLKLTQIPEWVGGLHKLKVLDFSENAISSIPESLCKLKNLEKLNLSSNQITHIPECLFELKKLRHLILSYNKIESISPRLARLTNLEALCLNKNSLTSVPEGLIELQKLQVVFLGGNRLNRFPWEISQIQGIEYFDMIETGAYAAKNDIEWNQYDE